MVQVHKDGKRMNWSGKVTDDRKALILFVALCAIWMFAEEVRDLMMLFFKL